MLRILCQVRGGPGEETKIKNYTSSVIAISIAMGQKAKTHPVEFSA